MAGGDLQGREKLAETYKAKRDLQSRERSAMLQIMFLSMEGSASLLFIK